MSYSRDVSVLVADDHAEIRKSLRHLLQASGMQVVGEAANGNEAVQECEHLHPQIIVLDISMPVLNGFEAAREIAKNFPATKIIFLTGHVGKEFVGEALRVGGSAFVSKTQASSSLVEAIEAALQGKTYFTGGSTA
jgi:DNA-binding NarL/FixJ family response regulator